MTAGNGPILVSRLSNERLYWHLSSEADNFR